MIKRKYLILFLFLFLSSVAFYVASQRSNNKSVDARSTVLSAVKSLKERYAIGTSDWMLSASEFEAVGFANCLQFVVLLRDLLADEGIYSRHVGVITSSGDAHDLLEVRIDRRWVLTDPMSGVMYENSFLEIIRNPLLAENRTEVVGIVSDVQHLVGPNFYSEVLQVNFPGIARFDSELRWQNFTNPQDEGQTFICHVRECNWFFEANELLEHFSLSEIGMIKFDLSGLDVSLSINGVPVNPQNYLIVNRRDGILRVETKAAYAHRFTVRVPRKPVSDAKLLDMRVPTPSVLVFRKSPVDISDAQMSCGDEIVWQVDARGGQEFFSAFFLAANPVESAWSKEMQSNGISYRSSILGLAGNEPRIRVLPLRRGFSGDCRLSIRYRAEDVAEVYLWIESEKRLFLLGVLPDGQQFRKVRLDIPKMVTQLMSH